MSHPMTDRALIESFTRAVLAEDAAAIVPYFVEHKIEPPSFRWNPTIGMLIEAPLKVLFRWWRSKLPAHGLPSIDSVDPLALKDALGYLMILA
jgi:hypothetical protein